MGSKYCTDIVGRLARKIYENYSGPDSIPWVSINDQHVWRKIARAAAIAIYDCDGSEDG